MDTTQVVIVGAGPCGLATAAELLRRGIQVRIFEASSVPSQGSKAIMLWPPAQAVLRDLEVLAAAQARAYRPDHLDYFGDHGRLARIQLTAAQSPLVLPQPRTDALLEEAVDTAGGTVERGLRLVALTQTGNAVEIVVRDESGRQSRLRTQWLVGADGVHSTVRELLGIAFAGSTLPTRFALAEGELAGAQTPTSPSYYLTSRGGLVIAPLPNGCVRVAGSIHDGREASEQLVQNMLDTRGPGGLQMNRFQALTTFSSAERVVERMRAGRVLLVGDAAHTHSAIGGQGLNLGLQDARNLSWKLAGVITGRLNDAIMDTYGPERIAAARQVIKTTGAITRVALAPPPWSILRNAVLRVAERTRWPPHWYAARVAGQRIRYPTTSLGCPPGPRGTGLPAPAWAALPADRVPDRFLLVTSGPPDRPLPRAADAVGQRHTSLISRHHVPGRRPEFLLLRPDGYVAARGTSRDFTHTERLLTAISPATASREEVMSSQHTRDTHAATYRRWAQAIANSDVEEYVSCFAPDAVVEDIAMGLTTRGSSHIREAVTRWFQAIGEEKLTLLAHLEGDGYSAVMWELSAVVQGVFTELSTNAQQGSRFTKHGVSVFRFNDDGQFVWERSHWDKASVLRQIEAPHDQ